MDIATLGLEADSSSIRHASKDLDHLSKEAGSTGESIHRLTAKLKTSALAFTAAGAAAAAALGVMTTRTLAAQDKIGKLAQQLGIGTRALSELQFVAEQTGSSAENLNAGLEVMSKRIGLVASTNTGQAKNALKSLGLAAEDLVKLKPDEAFQRISTAMAGLSTQSEKNAIASQLFSRANQGLVNILSLTTAEMTEQRAQARALGRSLSGEQTRAAAEAEDAMNRLHSAFTGVSNVMATALAPAITATANGFSQELADAMKSSRSDIVNWGELFGDTIAFSADAAKSSFSVINYSFQSLGSALGATGAELNALMHGNLSQVREIQKLYEQDQRKLDATLGSTNATRFRDQLAKVRERNKALNQANTPISLKPITVLGTPAGPAGQAAAKATRQQPTVVDVQPRSPISSQGARDMKAVALIQEQIKTQAQKINDAYSKNVTIVERANLDDQKRATLLTGLSAQHEQQLKQINGQYGQMSEFAVQAQHNIQDALGTTLQQTLGGHFDGIGEMWLDTVETMAANAASANLNNALFGDQKSGGKGLFGLAIGAAGTALSGWLGGGAASAMPDLAGMNSTSLAGLSGITAPGLASGGPTKAGETYVVGEKGPELWRANGPGHITPNHAMGRSGSSVTAPSIINNVSYHESPGKNQSERDSDRTEFMRQFQEATRQTVKGTLSDMASNGELDETLSPYNLNRNMAVT